jgi:hypothetical protein
MFPTSFRGILPRLEKYVKQISTIEAIKKYLFANAHLLALQYIE